MYLDPNDDAMRNAATERALERLAKGFMQPQVVLDTWLEVENHHGESTLIPTNIFRFDDLDAPPDGKSITVTHHINKWACRLSASGYMDCTDWTGPYETREEAERDLVEMYADDCEEDEEDQ